MKKQIFALIITFIINMFCLHSFSQTQITGMTATASSYSGNCTPSNAIDGSTSTYWGTASGATGQWLQLVLPGTYTLSSIQITWYSAPYNNCTVQFFNGSTLVQTITPPAYSGNMVLTVTPPTSPVNIIRINSDAYGGSAPVMISEVNVSGTASAGGIVNITGMTATASNSINGAASNAIDGDFSTRWGSTSGATGQWLQLSLPGLYRLSNVQITWGLQYNNCTVQFYNNATLVQTFSPGANTGNNTLLNALPPSSLVNKIVITSDAINGSAPVFINEVVVSGSAPIISNCDQINASSGFFSSNVGIGTTSPLAQLHLASDADHAFEISRANGTYGFRIFRNAQQGNVSFQIGTALNTWETKIKIGEGEGANTKLLLNPDGGNVGIGTTSPTNKLHIREASQTELYGTDTGSPISNLVLEGTASGRTVGQGPSLTFSFPANTDGSNIWAQARILATPDNTSSNNAVGRLYFQVRDLYNPGVGGSWNWRTGLMIAGNGNVGIGTTTPKAVVHIKAGAIPNLRLEQTNSIFDLGGDAISLAAGSTWTQVPYIEWRTAGGKRQAYLGWNPSVFNMTLENGYNFSINGGNVLIGKTTQTGTGVRYKLDVAGPIRADEVSINTTGADFVFEQTYKLRSLTEVETFINHHKHLPDIASAAEMQLNGVNIGDIQTKLLQKVEELTLYVIEKDKEIAALKAEQNKVISEQEKKYNQLEAELQQLKDLIKK